VWIGNWGDGERTHELREFFMDPVQELGLQARAYGVRYPPEALQLLADSGVDFVGWSPNFRVPLLYSEAKLTVHIPRRPYVEELPGVPTIRVFEALACGIPLISAPWNDCEGLFSPGEDFLIARDKSQMKELIRMLLADPQRARALADHGLQTILARHTSKHRVDELLQICHRLRGESRELEADFTYAAGARV
jgi:spore maturation protein CgeB